MSKHHSVNKSARERRKLEKRQAKADRKLKRGQGEEAPPPASFLTPPEIAPDADPRSVFP